MRQGWVCTVALLLTVGVRVEAAGTGSACRLGGLTEDGQARHLARAAHLGILAALEDGGLPDAHRAPVAAAIVRESERQGLDPRLVVAVIHAESAFRPRAVSRVGARGLMQIMPSTGRWLLERQGRRLAHSAHLFEPELNVELGTAYLGQLVRRFGTLERALVAYNAGPAAATRILSEPERRQRFVAGYPRKVLREFERLKRRESAATDVPLQGPTVDGTPAS